MAVGDIDDGVLLQSNELVEICDATTCVAIEKKLLPLVTIVIFGMKRMVACIG